MVIHDDDEAFNIFQGKPVPGSGWEDVSFFAEEMDVYVTYLLIAVDNTLGIEDRSLTQRVPFRQGGVSSQLIVMWQVFLSHVASFLSHVASISSARRSRQAALLERCPQIAAPREP